MIQELLTRITETKYFKGLYGIGLSILFFFIAYLINIFKLVQGRYFLLIAFAIGSANLLYNLYKILIYLKNKNFDCFFKDSNFKKYWQKQRMLTYGQVVIFLFVLIVPFFIVGGSYLLTDTEAELQNIVDDLIDDSMNETQKVDAILGWFNRGNENKLNFSNLYYRGRNDDIVISFLDCYIFDSEPYFGFRWLDNPDWIVTSKCGMCGETGTLFRAMGTLAGLNVSKVHCNAENHVWNEVYLEGKDESLIIDATAVDSSRKNSTGYKNREFMENKVAGDQRNNKENPQQGNVSFVYATFQDDSTRHNVTARYTEVINLTINVTDSRGMPLSNCSVKIKSYNRPHVNGVTCWGLEKETNSSGQVTFSLGGGRYKIELKHKDDFFSDTSKLLKFWEDDTEQYHNITYQSISVFDYIKERPLLILALGLIPILFISVYIDWKKKS